MMEQWEIEQEAERLQDEIKERNDLFMMKVWRRDNAAIVIQRAFRRFYRFKKFGVNTAHIL